MLVRQIFEKPFNAVSTVFASAVSVRFRAKLINLSTVAVVSIVAFREDDNAFPTEGKTRRRGSRGRRESEQVEAYVSLVIFITRKRLTPPLSSISPTNLCHGRYYLN